MAESYKFYGWEQADASPADETYKSIENPRKLYDLLSEIWCEYTCAPRLRGGWSPANKTLGQCYITAFLVQDIFGGKVYGILRPGGNYHCYNAVGNCVFDLTSEQFGSEKLDYTCLLYTSLLHFPCFIIPYPSLPNLLLQSDSSRSPSPAPSPDPAAGYIPGHG